MSIRKKILSNEFVVPAELAVPHFASLDGLRTVSVFIVLIAHANAEFKNQLIFKLLSGGTLGVEVFFVISGFLITTLLLKEKIKTNEISLGNFYIRRALRILPVAYFYLLVLFVLRLTIGLHVTNIEFLGAIFFLVNLGYFHTSAYNGHYWSLSVEEQFYIVFPFIIKKSYRLYINFILILLVAIWVVKGIDFRALEHTGHTHGVFAIINVLKELIYHSDGIIIGSLLSISMFKRIFPLDFVCKYKILLHIIFIPLIIIFFNDLFFTSVFNTTITAILIAVLLASNLRPSNDFIFSLLNNKIVKRIGVLSYGFYIWQQLFIFKFNNVFGDSRYEWPGIIVCFLMLSVVVYLSYNYFEKYFLTLKQKFTKVKSMDI